jgi:hypothetical protein
MKFARITVPSQTADIVVCEPRIFARVIKARIFRALANKLSLCQKHGRQQLQNNGILVSNSIMRE